MNAFWDFLLLLTPQTVTATAVWINSGRGTTPQERKAQAIRQRIEHRERQEKWGQTTTSSW